MLGEVASSAATRGRERKSVSARQCSRFVGATLSALGALLGLAAPAEAGGTRAGTLISNTADVSYEVSGETFRARTNSAVVHVERSIIFHIESVALNAADVVGFRVQNIGNACATPDLLASASDSSPTQIVLDTDGSGVFEAHRDEIHSSANASALCPDDSMIVFVVLSDGAADPTVTLRAGDAWRHGTTQQAGPVQVALVKRQSVVARPDATAVVSGDIIEYALQITATGQGMIDEMMVEDALPPGVSYIVNTLTLDGSSGAAVDATLDAIRVRLGAAQAPFERLLTFRVLVD